MQRGKGSNNFRRRRKIANTPVHDDEGGSPKLLLAAEKIDHECYSSVEKRKGVKSSVVIQYQSAVLDFVKHRLLSIGTETGPTQTNTM